MLAISAKNAPISFYVIRTWRVSATLKNAEHAVVCNKQSVMEKFIVPLTANSLAVPKNRMGIILTTLGLLPFYGYALLITV